MGGESRCAHHDRGLMPDSLTARLTAVYRRRVEVGRASAGGTVRSSRRLVDNESWSGGEDELSAAAGWVLGVDFGVVNTAAALRDPSGRVSELRLSSTGVLMPSAVFCPEQQLLVGDGALRAGLSDPGALVPYPKRRLADGMRCKLAVAGQQAYVPGLVAAVFADVRKRAREATGGDLPQDLMLSYPDIHHASLSRRIVWWQGLWRRTWKPSWPRSAPPKTISPPKRPPSGRVDRPRAGLDRHRRCRHPRDL